MGEHQGQMDKWRKRASARRARVEVYQRQTNELLRLIEEDQQLIEQSQRRTAQLLQQLLKAAEVIRANRDRADAMSPQ